MATIETMFIGLMIAFLSVLLIFFFGGLFFTAGPEGRFMIGRFFRRSGLDVLSYQRLSQELTISKIKWDGKYWVENKKTAILTGIDPEKGTDPSTKQYNKALSSTARWAGNKRSVLWLVDEMFFTFNHGFLDTITKATWFEPYMIKAKQIIKKEQITETDPKTKATELIKKDYFDFLSEIETLKTQVKASKKYDKSKDFIQDLLTQVQMGYEGVKIQTILTADEINKYLEGVTPRVLMEARDEGKVEGALEMTKPDKPPGLPPMVKALAISASVIIALVIAYVAITGRNPVDGIKDVLPN